MDEGAAGRRSSNAVGSATLQDIQVASDDQSGYTVGGSATVIER